MTKKQPLPVRRQTELVMQELKGEILIYDLRNDKAFCLNDTAALVWQLCDGDNDIAEISRQLSDRLKSAVNEDFVRLALAGLKLENLLANGEEIIAESGVSRRELIRKVGLSTMIALPVISALVAPKSADAQSATCRMQNQSCTTTTTYSQGTCCDNLRCDSSRCNACYRRGITYNSCQGAQADCQTFCDSDSRKTLCCNSGSAILDPDGLGGLDCECP